LRFFDLRWFSTQIVGGDAGVVGTFSGRAMMASSQSFSMIQRGWLSPWPASAGEKDEPLWTSGNPTAKRGFRTSSYWAC